MLPTWRIPSGVFRSAIHFPFSPIALLESKTERVTPTQIAADPNLPDVDAGAVFDERTNTVIWNKNGDATWPLASITKLMTALVVLDTNPNWDQVITWKSEYDREGARLYIQPGEQVTVRNLWYTMLVASANNATIALARSTGLSEQEFVSRMNAKAQQLNLKKTHFVEPTGLDPRNVSTAKEILIFSAEAFRHWDVLVASTSKTYFFKTSAGVSHWLRNTNDLLYSPLYVTGSKTGYIDESGYNLVMKTRGPLNQSILAVVLGTSSKASREASEEALINWAYRAFNWL
jgi:D-alanyl-D-alanine carboxypeptidase